MASKLSKVNLNDYRPLREDIFNTLREAIISGELKPNERLMEVKLAEKMGVSRTPVREAIRKLELEGLVKMIPRKGAHVAELSTKDIIDVLEIRATLDGMATGLAAERITDEEIKGLGSIQIQFENYANKDNLQGSIKKDVEFHDLIYKASRNKRLVQISSNLREQVQRFRVIYIKDYSDPRELIKEHRCILEAVSNHDKEKAVECAQRHIKNQERSIMKAVENMEY